MSKPALRETLLVLLDLVLETKGQWSAQFEQLENSAKKHAIHAPEDYPCSHGLGCPPETCVRAFRLMSQYRAGKLTAETLSRGIHAWTAEL